MDRKRLINGLVAMSFLLFIGVIYIFIGRWEEGAKPGFAGMVFYVGAVLGMVGSLMMVKLESYLKS
ncbi:hypothetical protein FTO68_02245 [Methanocalculus taiwanensis]|uniref:Uncharacterized protein n=1 Tax=Methanocalculus taiwanensis TaxID=106207 RepID=A0ABD4TKF3_9EURY|nr:hypothetical protein [Methanocalculus taiwanensis]MCQ1537810.1 hypothetical protein [Methanocalculus taiwanensis]